MKYLMTFCLFLAQWQPSGIIRGCQRDVRGLIFVPSGEASDLRSCSGEMDHLIVVGNETRLQILPCPRSDPGGRTPVPKHRLKLANTVLKVPPPIYLPFWPLSVTPALPMVAHLAENTFTVASGSQARLCLMQHADYMDLFRLPGKPKKIFEKKDEARKYLKLAHIQPKRGDHILTCCISPCGKYIGYSDAVRSRILKVEHPVSYSFLSKFVILIGC